MENGTNLLQLSGLWETPATCSRVQPDSSSVDCASWMLLIPLWLEPKYIILRTSHFFSVSSSSPIAHQWIMATHAPQPGECGSKSGQPMGASSNPTLTDTQHQGRHQLVHHNAANVANPNITQHAHLKIICKTGSGKSKTQHAIGCNYIHIAVNSHQLNIWCTVGIHRELGDRSRAASNREPPWSTKAFVHAVGEIEHHDVATSVIAAHEAFDKRRQE